MISPDRIRIHVGTFDEHVTAILSEMHSAGVRNALMQLCFLITSAKDQKHQEEHLQKNNYVAALQCDHGMLHPKQRYLRQFMYNNIGWLCFITGEDHSKHQYSDSLLVSVPAKNF